MNEPAFMSAIRESLEEVKRWPTWKRVELERRVECERYFECDALKGKGT